MPCLDRIEEALDGGIKNLCVAVELGVRAER